MGIENILSKSIGAIKTVAEKANDSDRGVLEFFSSMAKTISELVDAKEKLETKVAGYEKEFREIKEKTEIKLKQYEAEFKKLKKKAQLAIGAMLIMQFLTLLLILAVVVLGGLVGCTAGNVQPSVTHTPVASGEGTGPFAGYVKDASSGTGGMTRQWNGNDLDEAVKSAFLQDNQGHYLSGECIGEGHIILGNDKKSGITTVYALTMYGEYGFEDGNFVKVSGSGIIPAVFTFTDSEKGLVCTKIEYPEDGSGYGKSIKRLFPSKYQGRALSPSDSDRQVLTSEERSYAASYLKKIGRDAVIGDYGDFKHTLLTDAGVSVDVSNITCDKVYADYPIWIGNREALENGTRYVYEMSYNKEAHEIDFKKYEYDTNKTVEIMRLDSITGLQK